MSTPELEFTAADFEVAPGKTAVWVNYLAFGGLPIAVCQITIYTFTPPRHPVMAEIDRWTIAGWHSVGTQLVTDYTVGVTGGTLPETYRFTFDCPAPCQLWEIKIQTPPYNPLPDFLDSRISSCEPRA